MVVTQKEIEAVVSEVVGEDIVPVAALLKTKKNISEFDIANALKIPVDLTRNQLYRLYNNNLVTFTRKKDKRKGWYIYYWNLNPDRIKFLVTDLKRKRVERLKKRLNREQSTMHYSCPNNCIRTEFEQAMDFEFKCPECGELLSQEDNQELMQKMQKEVEGLEKELKEFDNNEAKNRAKLVAEEEKEMAEEEERKRKKEIEKIEKEERKKKREAEKKKKEKEKAKAPAKKKATKKKVAKKETTKKKATKKKTTKKKTSKK